MRTTPQLREIRLDMPAEEYHANPALSRSMLDKIIKSPAHFKHHLENGEPDRKAFLEGRVLHSLILEPTKFWQRIAVWEGGDKVKNAGAWKYFKAEHQGKDIITAEERTAFLQIEDSFFSRPITRSLLQGATIEASLFFERSLVECKARPDIITDGALYDLKFVRDVSQDEFERNAFNWGWHRQASWYLDAASIVTGRNYEDFYFVAIEKTAPYEIAVYRATPEVIAAGRAQNDLNFELYKRCKDMGAWPGMPNEVLPFSIPRRA